MSVPDDHPPASALTPVGASDGPASQGDPTRDLAAALHEVSNALTVVMGWIERARCAEGAGAEVQRALDVASSRSAHARWIVRRAIGAEPRAEPDESVGALVADALTGMEPELRRAGIDARVRVAADVEGQRVPHASSVLQILTNLLLNAAALSPRGSTVHVEAERAPDQRVRIAVTDAGPGVPPERRATIFQGGVSTRPGGAGIGLRHAAALSRARGGALALGDSETGARFELCWPLVEGLGDAEQVSTDRVVAPAPAPSARSLRLVGARVLVVEDDEAVIDLLDTALTARGADVVAVRHRRDLDAALAGGGFDAALFDISPIADDIHDAVARTRRAGEGVRVVMISGAAVAQAALPEGWIAAWVRKPFEIAEILEAIAPAPRG